MGLYMLSTDIATCLIRGDSNALDARVASVSSEELCISAVTRGELLLGVSRRVLHDTAVGETTARRRKRTYISQVRGPQGKGRDASREGDAEQAVSMDRATLEVLRKTMHNMMAALTPEEAKALRARFRIDVDSEHTLDSIAKQFDLTRERLESKPRDDSLSRVVDQFLTRVACLPWDAAAATSFAAVAFELHHLGTPLGTANTMIAGHAIAVGAVLVASGERDFPRVTGLKTENWTRRRATQ